ncbi:hypothetical protein KVMX100_110078 [Klebsiella variicola]|nr:hypothetical protein KVMX100_110078 [Klebsiella variicola]
MTMCFIVPPLSIRHRLQIIDNPRLRQRNEGISGACLCHLIVITDQYILYIISSSYRISNTDITRQPNRIRRVIFLCRKQR